MNRYPVLKLIIKYGTPGAFVLGFLALVGTFFVCFTTVGWLALPIAVVISAVVVLVVKSYAELILMITDMIVPS
jgi:hypothetical protein